MKCDFLPCQLVADAKGLCPGHYYQKYISKGGELKPLRVFRDKSLPTPTECLCGRKLTEHNLKISKFMCSRCYHLLNRHKLSFQAYAELLDKQEGVCAICKTSPETDKFLCVDHDHSCCPTKAKSCGKCVRGLLCNACNTGLGLFRDSPTLLDRAKDYLRK